MKLAQQVGLSWSLQKELINKARTEKQETCGFVTGNGIITVPNISSSPQDSFVMSPQIQLTLMQSNVDIYGVWHTHLSGHGYLSEGDNLGLANGGILPGWKYWIATRFGVYCWDWEIDFAKT